MLIQPRMDTDFCCEETGAEFVVIRVFFVIRVYPWLQDYFSPMNRITRSMMNNSTMVTSRISIQRFVWSWFSN